MAPLECHAVAEDFEMGHACAQITRGCCANGRPRKGANNTHTAFMRERETCVEREEVQAEKENIAEAAPSSSKKRKLESAAAEAEPPREKMTKQMMIAARRAKQKKQVEAFLNI